MTLVNPITQEQKDAWVEALRSGGYKQGVGRLQHEFEGDILYCCLGVLRKTLTQKDEWRKSVEDIYSEGSYLVYYGSTCRVSVGKDSQTKLSNANDEGRTFDDIATVIERMSIDDLHK